MAIAGFRNWVYPLMLVLACFHLTACASSTGFDSGAPSSSSQDESSSIPQIGEEDGDLVTVGRLPPPPNTNNGADVLIATNDLLEIDVFQVNDLDKEVRVEQNGKISLPLIGGVPAAGKTTTALEQDIERLYGANYLQNPEVSVFMKESAGQRITLDGAFAKPGIYPSDNKTTLLQATAQAGGLTELGDETKLFVFRKIANKNYVANYSLKDIRQGKQSNPRIYGGDTVIAFQSGSKIAARNLREALGIATSTVRLATPL